MKVTTRGDNRSDGRAWQIHSQRQGDLQIQLVPNVAYVEITACEKKFMVEPDVTKYCVCHATFTL